MVSLGASVQQSTTSVCLFDSHQRRDHTSGGRRTQQRAILVFVSTPRCYLQFTFSFYPAGSRDLFLAVPLCIRLCYFLRRDLPCRYFSRYTASVIVVFIVCRAEYSSLQPRARTFLGFTTQPPVIFLSLTTRPTKRSLQQVS